jgi:putative transposase
VVYGRVAAVAEAMSKELRKYLWGKHFWSPSYFAASCGGAPLSIIKQYIEQQNRPD